MNTLEHFAPGYSSIDDVRAEHGALWDATTLQKVADCPRYFEIRSACNLDPAGQKPARMVAGIAIHEALDYYYAHEERGKQEQEEAIELCLSTYRSFEIDRTQMDMAATHISEDHLREVLLNYFHHWTYNAIEIYEPLVLTIDDLDLSDVIAARFKFTDKGNLIIGESNLVMQWDVPGVPDAKLMFAGKPDLPVLNQAGHLEIMDHKTTSSYLSDWWAQKFEVSNKLRGYMAMLRSLLGRTPTKAVINAIYVGKHATNPKSKATKFTRFDFSFTPSHIDEAIHNWYAWKETALRYADTGYYPQGCSQGGCKLPHICKVEPEARPAALDEYFAPSERDFWTL